jgi:Carboxypeptidase regulatory-like domain
MARIMARIVHPVSAVLVFALVAMPPGTAAQAPRPPAPPTPNTPLRGSISGQVIDQGSRTPVRGASVAFLGTKHESITDTSGRFSQTGLGSGTYLLQVRAIGYGAASWVLQLAEGEMLDYVLEIAPLAAQLDPISVVAPPGSAERRLGEFEERRRLRQGVFFTAEQIQASHASTLGDMLRGIPGVRLSCRSQACVVQMTRGAKATGCTADWVVDGLPASLSGSPHIPIVGIIGIEIYRSVSEAPAEFLKPDSRCGVIVIWTKSGP